MGCMTSKTQAVKDKKPNRGEKQLRTSQIGATPAGPTADAGTGLSPSQGNKCPRRSPRPSPSASSSTNPLQLQEEGHHVVELPGLGASATSESKQGRPLLAANSEPTPSRNDGAGLGRQPRSVSPASVSLHISSVPRPSPAVRSLSPGRASPGNNRQHLSPLAVPNTTRHDDLMQLVLEAEGSEDHSRNRTQPLAPWIGPAQQLPNTDAQQEVATEQQQHGGEIKVPSFSSGDRRSSRSRNSSVASSLMRATEFQAHDSRLSIHTLSSGGSTVSSQRQRSVAFSAISSHSGSNLGSSLRSASLASLPAPPQNRLQSETPSLPPSVHTSMFSPTGSEISSASFFIGRLAESIGKREPSPEKQFMHVVELDDNRAQLWAQLGVDVLASQQVDEPADVISILSAPSVQHAATMPLPAIGNGDSDSHDVSTASMTGMTF